MKLFLVLPVFAGVAFAGPSEVPVLFTSAPVTSFGTSVFVVGSVPQLGSWNPSHSVKLVASNCVGQTCQWSVLIGLPESTSYEYKFIQRADCDTCYSNPANVSWESGANRTGATPASPPSPYPGKTVFYYSGWTNVSLQYSNTVTGAWTIQPMIATSNGLWRADGINRAGETNLVFVFKNDLDQFDNPDGIGGTNYETPLDAFVVRNGQIYNYWPPALVSTNRVETYTLNSTNLPSRIVRIYLPRGYDENATKRYPVLYMHDGQNLFLGMAGLGGSWNADLNAAKLIRFGKMRETIIVGIASNDGDRICEYTPPYCLCDGVNPGKGDKYAALLLHELKPYIDAQYRTLPDAGNTGALGSSMGGLISTYMGWEWTGSFTKIGAMSTAFWRCSDTGNRLAVAPKRAIRIYLDSGDSGIFTNDGLAVSMQARDNLVRNGYAFNIDLDHLIGYGDIHNEVAWDKRLPRCFTFLFPTSDEPNTVLDAAAPVNITSLQVGGGSNLLSWTSYRLRTYTVQGSTNETFSSAMTWSNLVTTSPEVRFWNYPSAGVTNSFRFIRVRQDSVPDWPN